MRFVTFVLGLHVLGCHDVVQKQRVPDDKLDPIQLDQVEVETIPHENFEAGVPQRAHLEPYVPTEEQIRKTPHFRFMEDIEKALGLPSLEGADEPIDIRIMYSVDMYCRLTMSDNKYGSIIATRVKSKVSSDCIGRLVRLEEAVIKDSVICVSSLAEEKVRKLTKVVRESFSSQIESRWAAGTAPGPPLIFKVKIEPIPPKIISASIYSGKESESLRKLAQELFKNGLPISEPPAN